ncbi:EIF2AK1 [Branchiostoma lanceolatum]|uniref:EIF2AK1 protein n=1 Tax=Branchiostoma lanceolatum TaxID=7740 RepID=A0A8S4MPC2_BRALA|nr:EIF2AK1 [Branchiostoma lanceolatum]
MAYISRFKEDFDDIEYLEKGGYGIVMKARNKIDGQYYAIKRVKLPSRQAGREKKLKEAIALAKLSHPNIVRYYHAWEESPPPGFQKTEDDKIIPTDVSSLPSATDSDLPEADNSSTEESKSDDDSIIIFEDESSATGLSDTAVSASTSASSSEESSNQDYTTNDNTSLESSISEKKDAQSVAPTTYLYIQMELCNGTLEDWLQKNPQRQETTSVNIIRQIASGLHYVHECDFIHRDLSPSNIFFSLDNVVKIGDFGLVTSIIDENEETANEEAKDNGVGNAKDSICHTKAVGKTLYRSRGQVNGQE